MIRRRGDRGDVDGERREDEVTDNEEKRRQKWSNKRQHQRRRICTRTYAYTYTKSIHAYVDMPIYARQTK